MESKNIRRNYAIIVVLLLVIGISIGYAALSATLNINGQTTIGKSSWDVHFENLQVTDGSVEAVTPAEINEDKTDINYSVKLVNPGDFYEFTVDVKNGGTIPAKISSTPTLAGLSDAQKEYTNYTVTYRDGSTVSANDSLAAGTSKTLRVKVEFKKDITSTQLPSATEDVDLTFAMNFIQG